MNSYEFNKIAGAGLAAVLLITVLNIAGNMMFAPHLPERPGMAVEVPESATAVASAPAQPAEPLPVRLAAATVEQGQRAARKCTTCHTFDKGGANRVGPNLWDIVGASYAHAEGFNYSGALKGAGGSWTFENLDKFIADPRGSVPGTKMTFAGVKDPKERADLLAYMRSLSDAPKPLPQ